MRRKDSDSIGFVLSETTLGEQLTIRRGDRSLSEISRQCGVSVATLSRIEAGHIELPGKDTMRMISLAYGLPLEMLAQLAYCGGHAAQPEISDDTASYENGASPADDRDQWSQAGTQPKHAIALTS